MDRPNLLLIVCDEMRWCDLGCYGGTTRRRDGTPLTPRLDAMAAGGCRAEHAVSNAPVCLPARSIILSGQHARTCCGRLGNSTVQYRGPQGQSGWQFEPYAPPGRFAFPDPTLPELLQECGYHTRLVGKWHVDAWPHHLGYDSWTIARTHHANSGQLYTRNGGPEFAPAAWGPKFETDLCTSFLRDEARPMNDAARPWFLHLNLGPPHMPLADMPAYYLDLVDPERLGMRGNVPDSFDLRTHEQEVLDTLWDFRHYLNRLPHACVLPPDLTLRKLTAMYLGAMAWVDDLVGRVLTALDAAGLGGDTLACFTSDHGDLMGSHDRMGKCSLYEESYRVPMLFCGRGVRAGHAPADGVASLVDLCPTFLAAAGFAVPAHVQGNDLTGCLAGTASPPAVAVVDAVDGGTAARSPTALFCLPRRDDLRVDGSAAGCLYDLDADPLQLDAKPGDMPSTEPLRDHLLAWDRDTPVTPLSRFPVTA